MRNLKIILGIAVLVLAVRTGWEVGSAVVANMNFQEALGDMGSQAGAHVGVVVPPDSDEDAVRAVIRKAKEHGLELEWLRCGGWAPEKRQPCTSRRTIRRQSIWCCFRSTSILFHRASGTASELSRRPAERASSE